MEPGVRAQGCEEERNPVPAEQLAKSPAGKPCADCHQPRLVVPGCFGDFSQLFFVAVEGIIFLDCLPREVADLRNHGHIHPMLLAFLEFGKRMFLVADIDHDDRPTYVDVQLVFRNAHESSHPLHVPVDSVRVCSTLHQHFPCAQQQIELAAQQEDFFFRNTFVHCHIYVYSWLNNPVLPRLRAAISARSPPGSRPRPTFPISKSPSCSRASRASVRRG